MRARRKLVLFLQGFAMLNLLWWAASALLHLRALPSPLAIYLHPGLFVEDRLWLHVGMSLYRIAVGLAISLAVGVGLGLAMAYSAKWDRILNPLIYLTYPVPKTALLPVVMILFGLGDGSKITVIVLIVVFQVLVTVRGAAKNIPPETYNHLRSLGANRAQVLRHVTLPAILPELLTNTRVAIGTALSVLFFTEGYGTSWGIGYYILDAWSRLDYVAMYAGILAIGLLGFALFLVMDALEERLCRWKGTVD